MAGRLYRLANLCGGIPITKHNIGIADPATPNMGGTTEFAGIQDQKRPTAIAANDFAYLNFIPAEVQKLALIINASDTIKADIHLEAFKKSLDFRPQNIACFRAHGTAWNMNLNSGQGARIQGRHQIVGDDGQTAQI